MNFRPSACAQSSSERCSITPPGAEPALLTMMSTRPSAWCALATKFFASRSLVRSAGMATILRFVSRAIAAAASSSGPGRRAQIATATPSRARPSAMPRPMPSLPPVTSAVLPSSPRSIAHLPAGKIHLCTNDARRVSHARQAPASARLPPHRLRRLAERFDRYVVGVEAREYAARAALEPLVAPRECADQTALAQHELNVAADVLGVQQALLERPIVERKDVGRHLAARALVHVLEAAEKFRRRLSFDARELRGDVRAHVPDRRVHGMVARAGVHAEPFDLALEHPVHGVNARAGVITKIAHEVLLRDRKSTRLNSSH